MRLAGTPNRMSWLATASARWRDTSKLSRAKASGDEPAASCAECATMRTLPPLLRWTCATRASTDWSLPLSSDDIGPNWITATCTGAPVGGAPVGGAPGGATAATFAAAPGGIQPGGGTNALLGSAEPIDA